MLLLPTVAALPVSAADTQQALATAATIRDADSSKYVALGDSWIFY